MTRRGHGVLVLDPGNPQGCRRLADSPAFGLGPDRAKRRDLDHPPPQRAGAQALHGRRHVRPGWRRHRRRHARALPDVATFCYFLRDGIPFPCSRSYREALRGRCPMQDTAAPASLNANTSSAPTRTCRRVVSGPTQLTLGVRPRWQHRRWDRESMSLTELRAK